MPTSKVAEIEMRLLVDAIYQCYGHDFRDYAMASMKRRLLHAQQQMGTATLSALQERVLHEPEAFDELLTYLTVPLSEMFRDPPFYRAVRSEVVPVLRTYPSIKVWVAGCSTGEEAYSMAILLQEEGLLDRAIIYATDINPTSLARARQGIFATDQLPVFTRNYQDAGGLGTFSDYYTAAYEGALFDKRFRDSITFADHSLASDSVFSETHFISCRNVLIYFNKRLQDRALGLFHDSLAHRGFLGLGSKESLEFSAFNDRFEPVSRQMRIYRKLPGAQA